MNLRALPLAALVLLSSVAACKGDAPPATPAAPAAPAEPASGEKAAETSVEVPLVAKSGSNLSGKAMMTQTADGVRVVIDVANVTPGQHAAHVHEKGDCSSPDGKSAGDHFSPDGHPHALPPTEPRHIGDFGNMTVGADGKGHLEITAPKANLKDGDAHSFLGRAVIVHAKVDDGNQPNGNAGERIGCGEIKK